MSNSKTPSLEGSEGTVSEEMSAPVGDLLHEHALVAVVAERYTSQGAPVPDDVLEEIAGIKQRLLALFAPNSTSGVTEARRALQCLLREIADAAFNDSREEVLDIESDILDLFDAAMSPPSQRQGER